MAGRVGVTTVDKETSNVDNTNQNLDVSVAGSFTPTFAKIWTEGMTTNGTSTSAGVAYSEGWVDSGGTVWSCAVQYEEASADMDTSRICSKTKLLKVYADDGTLDAECEFVSFSTDRLTVKWTTSSATAIKLHIMLMDPTNSEVVFQTAKTSTGSQTISHSAFSGNAYWTMNTTQTSLDTQEDDAMIGYGMTAGPTNEQSISASDKHAGANSDGSRGKLGTAFVRGFDADGNEDFRAAFVTSASGSFDVTWDNAAPSAYEIGYAVFEFEDVQVSSNNNASTSTTENTITGLGFTPNAVCTTTIQSSSGNTGDGVFQTGAADGESTENNACAGYYTEDGDPAGTSGIVEENAACVRMTFSNGSDRATGAVTGYGSGTVEFTWTQVSGQRQFQWMAMDIRDVAAGSGRIMSSLADGGGLAGSGGIAGLGGGLAG